MERPSANAKKLHLLILTDGSKDPEAQARKPPEGTVGLESVLELDRSAVIASLPDPAPYLLADPEALFRAAVPAAIRSALSTLEPEALLLVEIRHDNANAPSIPTPEEIAALENALKASSCGIIHGQALCWPQHYMINSETFCRLHAETRDMHNTPFVWPSPSVYSPSEMCFSFLELWIEYVGDPHLSRTPVDTSRPSSPLLREHQMSYAIASILAHQAGIDHFAPSCAVRQVTAEAGASLPPELEAAWCGGGLVLADAGRWLQAEENTDPLLAVGRAAARPTDRLVLRQLEDTLRSGTGQIRRDHLKTLLRQSRSIDPVHETLLSDRIANNERFWNSLVSRVNLICVERHIDGLKTDLSDVSRMIRDGLCIEMELSDALRTNFNGQLVWILLGLSRRRRFRALYGRVVTPEGGEAMRGFLRGIDAALLKALIESEPQEAKGVLREELLRQFEFWMKHGG